MQDWFPSSFQLWVLHGWYLRERAWFEAQTQATTFPDFWSWCFNRLTIGPAPPEGA